MAEQFVNYIFFVFDIALFLMLFNYLTDDEIDIRHALVALAATVLILMAVAVLMGAFLGTIGLVIGFVTGIGICGCGMSRVFGIEIKRSSALATLFVGLPVVFVAFAPLIIEQLPK